MPSNREPQHDGTLASLAAAPVWLLVWLLTAGRFGRPLWRRVRRPRAPRPGPPPGQGPREVGALQVTIRATVRGFEKLGQLGKPGAGCQ